jgi:two-component system phosphate regulon response regulator OmpR
MLRRYLTDEGCQVSDTADGAGMRSLLDRESFDVVLLDLMMPGEDGLTLARQIRQKWDVPIIMLSGKGELIDRVVGLESGADDYITKPFELREVLARIRAVLRRAGAHGSLVSAANNDASPEGGECLTFAGWRLDLIKRQLVNPGGDAVALTSGEFELLRVFANNPNRVLSRERLIDLVKGREWAAYDRAIDTQVGRLRKKIESDLDHPDLIKTVRGGGYVFTAAVKSA